MRFYFQIWAGTTTSGKKKQQPKNHDNPSCVSNLNWNCYSAICNTYCHIKVILLYFLPAGSAPVTKQQILGFEGIFGGELELSWKIQGHNSLWSWKKWNFFRPDVTKLWEFGCFPLISNPSGVSAAPPPSLHENIIYKHAGTFTFFPFFFYLGKFPNERNFCSSSQFVTPSGWSPAGFVPLLEQRVGKNQQINREKVELFIFWGVPSSPGCSMILYLRRYKIYLCLYIKYICLYKIYLSIYLSLCYR